MRTTRSASFRRPLLLALAVTLGVCWLGQSVLFAQTSQPAVPAPGKVSVVSTLILGNRDFVTYTIFALSIASLTFIIRGFMFARQEEIAPPATTDRIRDLIARGEFDGLVEFVREDPSFVSQSLRPALLRLPNQAAMTEALESAVGEQTADAFRRIEILNIIGNLGPLLGLLGTVLGMIGSFDAMNRAGGSADPKLLAGGIATALAHTFLGLFLAIPTLAAFGILRTQVDRLTSRAALLSEELLAQIRDTFLPTAGAAPAPTTTATRPAFPE